MSFMKQAYSTLLFCILFILTAHAQEPPKLPEVIPPSPTAFELGKFGELPVGMFNGTPNVSIPLYSYSTKNMAVPITLSYSNPGLRVDQLSSWVGLGWNLNIGGVITRQVKGLPDEHPIAGLRRVFPDAEIEKLMYNSVAHPVATKFIYDQSLPNKDGEYDIYNFNFNGNTGQFVIDGRGRILEIGQQNPLKITFTGTDTSKRFYITTSDGVKHFFEEVEYSETSNSCSNSGPNLRTITSWYLTKMVHPKKDTLYFTYDNNGFEYATGRNQKFTLKLTPGKGESCPCPENNYDNCLLYLDTDAKKLARIYSSNPQDGEVIVTSNLPHPEVAAYDLLEKIEVKYGADIREQFLFNYSNTANNRVFLDGLTQKNPAQKYNFTYLDKDDFPARLSFSQDHWGYFNGKPNSNLLVKPNSDLWNPVQGLATANRDPDSTYTGIGLLTKVTYPTGGSTELIYEPNTWYGGKNFYTDKIYTVNSNPSSPVSSVVTFMTSSDYQNSNYYPTRLTAFGDLDNIICDQCSGDAVVTLTDITSNQVVYTGAVSQDNSLDVPVQLTKNHNYELKVVPSGGGYHYAANIRYYNQQIITDNHVGPGMRVQKTKAYDPVNSGEIIKKYYYASRDNLAVSSGTNYVNPVYESAGMTLVKCSAPIFLCLSWACHQAILSSSTVRSAIDQRAGMIYYKYVTTSLGGDNFETGQEFREFIVHQVGAAEQVWGSGYYSNAYITPVNQDAGDNGFEKKLEYYKRDSNNALIKQYSRDNFYPKENSFDFKLHNYLTVRNGQDPCQIPFPDYQCTSTDISETYSYPTCTTEHEHIWKPFNGLTCVAEGSNNVLEYRNHPCFGLTENDSISPNHPYIDFNRHGMVDMVRYAYIVERYPLTQTTERSYDENGQNPLQRTTRYYYDNPEHLQITRTEVIDSQGDTLLTKVYYPDDLATLGGLTTAQQNAIKKLNLNDQHRVSQPIQTESYRNGSLLTTQRTLYKDWGSGIVLPEIIETKKGSTAPFEKRIRYHKYDPQGNPLEVSQADGSPISYLWGYQGKYPVAKIANATHAQATATGLNLTILNAPASDTQLRSELNKLRSGLPGAMVTTYTYQPLVGATSTTDPSGYTTYYSYDPYNRLQDIKDNDSFLQQEYLYHYKGETTPGQGFTLTPITGPQNRFTGETGNYTIGVVNGSGDYTITWQLEKANGSTTLLQTTPTISYLFDNASIGTNTLRCTVIDNQNNTQQQATLSITVNPPQVISEISTANPWVLTGSPVNFSISASGGSGNFTYQCTFNSPGDAPITATGASVNLTFPTTFNDVISVNCEVHDTGLGNKIYRSLSVQGYTPVTQNPISGVDQAAAEETLNFTANPTGGSGNYQYNWSFSPSVVTVTNSTGQQVTAELNTTFSGTLTVTSTLTDTITGSTATQTKNVSVYAALNAGTITAGFPMIDAGAGTADYDFTINPGGGSGTYSYRWYVDNLLQPSATTNVLSYQLSCGETKAIKCEVTDTVTNAMVTQTQNFSFNNPSVCN
jgi:YD repeat-containing protein